MKSVKHYVGCLLLAVAASALMACSLDDLDTTGSEQGKNGKVGYLQLKSLVLNTDNESVELNTDTPTRAEGDEIGQIKYAVPNPNGIEENIDTYWIEVRDEITQQMVDINGDADGVGIYYKDIPTEGIALEVGRYTVFAYKTKNKGSEIEGVIADVAGQTPAEGKVLAYYMGYAPATIASEQTTQVEITCKLANVLTTVELSADLVKWFKKNDDGNVLLSTVVAIAPAVVESDESAESYSYEFPYTSNHGVADDSGVIVDGGPFVYFKDVAGPSADDGNVLNLTMAGTFYTGLEVELDGGQIDDSKWADVSMSRAITNVKAAQWRRISIDIDRNNEGNIQFVVTIESYVYDATIDVDVMTLYASLNIEEEVPDVGVENPLAPSISIDGVTADENGALPFAINSSMYDSDAESWTSFLKVKVTPQEGSTVKEIYAVLTSDNADLLSAMTDKGFVDGRVNIFSDVATAAEGGDASEYLSVKDLTDGQAGEKLVTVKATGMSALYKYPGTHTASVYTVDSNGRRKHTDIIITVTSGGGSGVAPTIVWMKDGENVIDQRHNLTADNASSFSCKVDMTSESGFTKLEVDIVSSVLTDSELQGVGLGSHIDLINPTAEQVGALQGLGFLPDGVTSLKGYKEASFDISGFMGMLYGIFPASDNCDFNITVGDANGTTEKSLMFYVDVQ